MARRNDDEFVACASARQAQLRRTACLMCGDWQLAADIVQEALIRTADHASAVSDRHALMAALTRLPDRQRACVVLRYLDDLPVGEVAALLGCSDGTVKSQTSRALRSLQSMFKARGAEELVVSREGGESW